MIRSLDAALSSIKIHTYALTDEAIIESLLNKSRSIQDLEVITDAKTIPSFFSLIEKPLHWKRIKSSGLMHEKITIIDNTTVFLGTANMTYESLSMHDNLILGFHAPALAHYLTLYTEEIETKKKYKNISHQLFSIEDQSLELWLLPYKGSAPLDRLKTLIQEAHSSLLIAMFTLTHPEILEELIQAHKRGVLVKVFLDHTSAQGASSKALTTLLHAHIPVYLSNGLQLLHYKMMVIDQHCFVLGSANWTKAAFKKNHDFYVALFPLHINQTKALSTIFKKIERESSPALL